MAESSHEQATLMPKALWYRPPQSPVVRGLARPRHAEEPGGWEVACRWLVRNHPYGILDRASEPRP